MPNIHFCVPTATATVLRDVCSSSSFSSSGGVGGYSTSYKGFAQHSCEYLRPQAVLVELLHNFGLLPHVAQGELHGSRMMPEFLFVPSS